MARKTRDTGGGIDYNQAEAERVVWELEGAYAAWGQATEPTRIDVTARIEWAGHVMQGRGGMRRTRLEVNPGPMRAVRAAVEEAAARRTRAANARAADWRRAKGWHAQLRELVAAKHGSAAADRAGLDIKARTLRAWLSDDQHPVRPADQRRIQAAYQELKEWNVREAAEAAGRAQIRAAEVLTEVLRERYGQNIRLRDITSLRFE